MKMIRQWWWCFLLSAGVLSVIYPAPIEALLATYWLKWVLIPIAMFIFVDAIRTGLKEHREDHPGEKWPIIVLRILAIASIFGLFGMGGQGYFGPWFWALLLFMVCAAHAVERFGYSGWDRRVDEVLGEAIRRRDHPEMAAPLSPEAARFLVEAEALREAAHRAEMSALAAARRSTEGNGQGPSPGV